MKSLKSQTKVWKLSTLMVTPHMYEVVYKYNTNPASCRLINTNTIPTQLHAGLLIQIQYDTSRLHAGLLSCRVPRPRWWGKGGTIKVNRSLKVYCILSNAEITCSPDQKSKLCKILQQQVLFCSNTLRTHTKYISQTYFVVEKIIC